MCTSKTVRFGMVSAGVATVLAVGGFALGSSLSDQFGGQSSAVASLPGRAQDAAIQTIANFSADGAQVFALRWVDDENLWFVKSGPGDTAALIHYEVSQSKSTVIRLPGSFPPTPHTYLASDRTGLLWVAAGYSLAALDPRSGSVVSSQTLNLKPPDAEPGALDPGAALPGTWVNGMAVDGGGSVRLTRNNVKAIYRVSTAGVERTSELSASPAGLRIVDGAAKAFRSRPDYVEYIDDGVSGARFAAGGAGCGLSGSLSTGVIALTAGGKPTSAPTVQFNPRDPVGSSGNVLALGLMAEGAILRFDCTKGLVERFSLEVHQEIPDGGGIPSASGDSIQPVEVHAQPQSIAVSEAGHVAFGLNTGQVGLIRWRQGGIVRARQPTRTLVPPSTGNETPVMKFASSEARKSAA